MSPLFNRNKKTTIAELEEYYANQSKADSSARAWAMAVLSLLITLAVILALFFAGRWLWRTVTDDDNSNDTGTTQQEGVTVRADGTLSGDLSLLDNESSDTQNGGSVSIDTESSDISGAEEDTQGTVSDEAASTDESNEDTVANNDNDVAGISSDDNSDDDSVATSQDDVVGTNSTELPNTGAGSALVVIPAATAIAGYAVSRRRQLNR